MQNLKSQRNSLQWKDTDVKTQWGQPYFGSRLFFDAYAVDHLVSCGSLTDLKGMALIVGFVSLM